MLFFLVGDNAETVIRPIRQCCTDMLRWLDRDLSWRQPGDRQVECRRQPHPIRGIPVVMKVLGET